jgi:hypothetical protein
MWEDRFKEVYTNEQGYTFFIDKDLTDWANRGSDDKPYIVYLVKSGDTEEARLLCNNKEQKVLAELSVSEDIQQACAKIDVYKIWSKDDSN